MAKYDILEVHGTTVGGLTPGALVTAAEYDMRRRERNVEDSGAGACEHYAFHRKHVLRASKAEPSDRTMRLITLAIEQREIGIESGKKSTRLIYKDEQLLKEALEMAAKRVLSDPVNEG